MHHHAPQCSETFLRQRAVRALIDKMARYRQEFATLIDLIEFQAAALSTKTALIVLDNHGNELESLSFADLAGRARALAVALRRDLQPGDRVVLALASGVDAVIAFLGTLYADLLPALAAPPRHARDRRGMGRIERIAASTAARRVFLAPEFLATAHGAALPETCEPICIESLEAPHARWTPPTGEPHGAAYLQFTSGSTQQLKGVVLSHANVLANLAFIDELFRHDPALAVFGWLPLHHDMGLVGHVLEPLYVGACSILAPPAFYSSRPLNWLEAISRYRAASSGAPPFAYHACAAFVGECSPDLDLSCWANAYVGAEAVPESTLAAFTNRFAKHGFRQAAWLPCYGLAEATLLVAGGHRHPGWESHQSTDRRLRYAVDPRRARIRILAPGARHEVAPGEIGEIALCGPSVAPGYYQDPERTHATFIALDDGAPYLRTGDLGLLAGDDLVVTGRSSDLLIICGVNYHAEDLEQSIRQALEPQARDATACFSVPDTEAGTEQVVLVQEVKTPFAGHDETTAAMRDTLAQQHGLQLSAIAYVRRGAIPRTSSGKISRSACRSAYLEGKLDTAATWEARSIHQRPSPERIAVIGMACRFPGADGSAEFWSKLAAGFDAITEVPSTRWDVARYYDPRPAIPGKMNTCWGGFLEGIDKFDAPFFGIAPGEAAEMDPQQRIALEVVWRAIEDAGLQAEALAGSSTGVFLGISTTDYLFLQIEAREGMEAYNAYTGLGNSHSIAANRISYAFDLRGPSMALDTGCSSALTAIHLALQSLRRRESSLAIAGGVNAILSPGTTITLSQFNMLSPDGRCKPFDASADGYVRSEGCGIVILKREADAIRDGDRVLAYILGSALTQDGRTAGLTAPNAAAQREAMEKALADAGCSPATIGFVEAHGTGTAAGDPVEVEQIRRVYGSVDGPQCLLGAVKANIGHSEAAAGVAAFIKMVLALEHAAIPPQIHLTRLNPRISLDQSRLTIPHELTAWSPADLPRRGAVSSFGFGGANAHLIAESAKKLPEWSAQTPEAPMLLPLSAKSEAALLETVRHWLAFLQDLDPAIPATHLARAQALRRSHFAHRAAFAAASRRELRAEIEGFLASPFAADHATDVTFLFSGQGTHYAGMGLDLYRRFPAYREAFDRCASAFQGESLADLVFSGDVRCLQRSSRLQPALFATEYALAQLWIALGIKPAVLLGHSLGEYAAACLAGCFEPEDGITLLCARGELVDSLTEPGAMAAVSLGESALRAFLEREQISGLSIAAVNSAGVTVIAGATAPLKQASAILERQGIAVRALQAAHAFHSAMMDDLLDRFETEAARAQYRPPRIPLVSNLTGALIDTAPDAAYWRRHLRECVRFADGIGVCLKRSAHVFLEIGPGDALIGLARRQDASQVRTLRSMHKPGAEVETFLRSAGRLYALGATLDWRQIYGPAGVMPIPGMPGHPFHRRSYWFDDRTFEQTERTGVDSSSPQPHSNWIYSVNWKQSPTPLETRESMLFSDETQQFVIIGEGGKLAAELAALLRRHKRSVERISGNVTNRLFGRSHPVDAAERYAQALNSLFGRAGAAQARWNFVYLRALDGISGAPTVETLETDQRDYAVADLAALIAALDRAVAVKRLWIVTAGAQPVDGCVANPSQATVWGLGNTLFLEHPEIRGSLTDIDPMDPAAQQAREILASIAATDGESLSAFRGSMRYVPRLKPAPIAERQQIELRPDASYLVTGGLGGLGLRLAVWMAQRGAGHIVLLGRRSLPARELWDTVEPASAEHNKIAMIRKAEQAGATVETVALDITEHARVAEVIRTTGGKLRGIVHAAGENWLARLNEIDRPRMLETLKIKVSAAWNLHELTRDLNLDFFVLYSSVSALWGSVGLGHYTAANHFLDALAWRRRTEGRHALAIDWGPWAAAGMSASPEQNRLLVKLGLRLMHPDQALEAMEQLLLSGATQAVVADIDWPRFQTFVNFAACASLFAELSEHTAVSSVSSTRSDADRIRALPPAQAQAALLELLRRHLAAVLLVEPGREIDARTPFNLMGMDSLMAIAFALRVEALVGTRLPTTLAYNYPTLAELADHLHSLMRNGELPAPQTPPAPNLWFRLAAEKSSSPRLFCFPYAGAGASIYKPWIEQLADSVDVVPVQLPGREERVREAPVEDLATLAHRIADALAQLQPTPFAFFGHSMGALLAFETARELHRRHAETPRHLFLSACGAPGERPPTELHRLPDDEFRREVVALFGAPGDLLANDEVWQQLLPALRADVAMMEHCRFDGSSPLDVPITLLGGRADTFVSREDLLAWSRFTTGDLALRSFPGGHTYFPEAEPQLLQTIREQLARSAVIQVPVHA